MSDAVAPDAAYVIAVGIERYEYGPEMNLPGAASAAWRFVQWALACGVPPGRVVLATTWLEQEPWLPADILRVEPTFEVLRRTIIGLGRLQGELLMVFWCGHGVLDYNNRRALYTSDATVPDKRNVPVDGMLYFLATNAVPSFPRQVALIDACANFVEGMGYQQKLPDVAFPAGKRREISQYSFFAAGQGQIAPANQTRRETTFSVTVLDWLTNHGGQSLPPDVSELTRHVQEVFKVKETAGELRARPVYRLVRMAEGSEIEEGVIPVSARVHAQAASSPLTLSQVRRIAERIGEVPMLASPEGRGDFLARIGRGDGSAAGLADIVACFASTDEPEVARSFAALRELATTEPERLSVQQAEACWARQQLIAPLVQAFSTVTFQQVREAFFRAMPPEIKHRPRSLDDALDIAADCLPPRDDDHTALHRLMARLERVTGSRVSDAWYRLAPDRLNAVRAEAAAEAFRLASLVIDLRNPACPPSSFVWPPSIDGHLRIPGGEWTKITVGCDAGVKSAVARLVEDAHARARATFTIGFIVNRAALDEIPEAWLYGDMLELPAPIWRQYPTVLHCAERLTTPRARAWWSEKAAAIKATLINEAPRIRWLESFSRDDPRSFSELVRSASEACLGLAFAPGAYAGDLRRDPLIATVAGGAPFVIWIEHEPADWDAARALLVELIDSGTFEDLPERVRRLRAENGDGLADEIRLLWDEPDWLPTFGELPGMQVGG